MGNPFSKSGKECELKMPVNERPIIGILSQDCPEHFAKYGKSYIAASYVKYIESAGARVVPIRIDLSKEKLETLFNCINGVLLPGGGASLIDSGYFSTGKIIYDLALQAYDAGDTFPLWGTCLGFEMLNIATSGQGKKELLEPCDAENYAIPLDFTSEAFQSQMFGSAPGEVIKTLKEENVTFNNHVWCIPVEKFRADNKLAGFFKALSTSKDRNGWAFISDVEGKTYPIYGTQWHPEKNQFEWEPETIDHSSHAVTVGQYMANFFVSRARQNMHKFSNAEEEERALIYNYSPVDTSQESSFQQCYFF